MRKLRFPSWNEWLKAVESALKTVSERVNIPRYDISGQETNGVAMIKTSTMNQASMPFIETRIVNIIPNWDSEASGAGNYEGYTNTAIGQKSLKQTVPIRERLLFSVEVFTQFQHESIEISQEISRYFGPKGTFSAEINGSTYTANSRLTEGSFRAFEANETGKVNFYLASWLLELQIKSDLSEEDVIEETIANVSVDSVVSDGSNDSDELEKMI